MATSRQTGKPMPDHDAWPTFTVPWNDNSPGPTDMSRLLEKPAGAKGFIRVVDGHLATGDGKRWRMWGLNLCTDMPLPPMDLAPVVARRLAKYGLNCIRLHAMDHRWPNGILMRSRDGSPGNRWSGGQGESTRLLDPEGLARLDYFIACCKEQGVYLDLNLNVARRFTEADGVKQAEQVSWGKGLTYFDERLIFLQKEYARQLVDHLNPFTGKRYADEPAIALIELVNENSLLEFWVRGWLSGGPIEPGSGGWRNIPSAYVADLGRRWNAWLARKYEDREALKAAWDGDLRDYEDAAMASVRRLGPADFEGASTTRFRDEALFYAEIERDFFLDMKSYLQGTLGARQLILGTSDHNHGWSALPMLEANATLDVMDGHIYWQHPRARVPEVRRSASNWMIINSPMVDQPDASMPAQLSRSIVKGLPNIVSECNEPFPNDYAAEFIPLAAAYGLLQDWDGILFYDYDGGWRTSYWHQEEWRDESILPFFSVGRDPMKMPQMAIGALVFLRGDVQAANQTIERSMPHDFVLDSLRTRPDDQGHPYWMPDLPGRLALVHRTVIADFDAETLSPIGGQVRLPPRSIVSDTGELTWEDVPGDGRVLIDAPRHQAIIGRAGERSTRNMDLDLSTPFASVELASLDARSIAQADRMLLVAVARVANTGMRWIDDGRQSLGSRWGGAPTRIEPVLGTLTLRNLEGAKAISLRPLDGCGQPMDEVRQASRAAAAFVLELTDKPATTWYLVEVER